MDTAIMMASKITNLMYGYKFKVRRVTIRNGYVRIVLLSKVNNKDCVNFVIICFFLYF